MSRKRSSEELNGQEQASNSTSIGAAISSTHSNNGEIKSYFKQTKRHANSGKNVTSPCPATDGLAAPGHTTVYPSFGSTTITTPNTSFWSDAPQPTSSIMSSASDDTVDTLQSQDPHEYDSPTTSEGEMWMKAADEAEGKSPHGKSECPLLRFYIPPRYRDLNFELQWEISRVLQLKLKSKENCEEWLAREWQKPRDLAGLYRTCSQHDIRFQRSPIRGNMPETHVRSWSATLNFSRSHSGPVFDVIWQPASFQLSNHLERLLGSDRVLHLELPNLNRIREVTWPKERVLKYLRQHLCQPQLLFGRNWYTYFLQPLKKDAEGRTRLTLIACETDEEYASIMNSLLPLETNKMQMACKAFMRLELYLSRTYEGPVLPSDDIEYGRKDITATDKDDATGFDDPELSVPKRSFDKGTVMTDGCSEVSSWVLADIARKRGLEDNQINAVQARIAGAKGLWILRQPTSSCQADERLTQKAIALSESQIKVKHASIHSLDSTARCLAVLKTNALPKPSVLYRTYMPILLDRGVPRGVLLDLVKSQVSADVAELVQALKSGNTLAVRYWLHSQYANFEEQHRKHGIELLNGFPRQKEEQIIQMLESCFLPKHDKYLSTLLLGVAESYFYLYMRNFRIRLPESTSLWGVPDFSGCLAPGEIHVALSSIESFQHVGLSGLVARNPALAPWDIQKVKIVFKPELSHLKNLIVFSTQGRVPLASILQGGDYDGDTFWLTWNSELVSSFKNHPPPISIPPPKAFGIVVDRTKMGSFFPDGSDATGWQKFTCEGALKRTSEDLLGRVTKDLERLIYAKGEIRSPEVSLLIHLHDYLVDAAKQGYSLDEKTYFQYLRKIGISPPLKNPLYTHYTKKRDKAEEKRWRKDSSPYLTAASKNNGRESHILDEVFQLMEPVIDKAIQAVKDVLGNPSKESRTEIDKDLTKFYKDTLAHALGPNSDLISAELKQLKRHIDQIYQSWNTSVSARDWEASVQRIRHEYDEIKPTKQDSATIIEWQRRQGDTLTTWEKLKASCFALNDAPNAARIMFTIAGSELCYLKLCERQSISDRRTVKSDVYRSLKLAKRRRIPSEELDAEDEDEDEDWIDEEGDVVDIGAEGE